MHNNLADILQDITSRIESIYDTREIAYQNAWFILEFVTHKKQAQLIVQKELMLVPEQYNHIEHIIYQLTVLHKPLQYILGFVPFLDLTIKVKSPILIPRPETEEWVYTLIQFLKKENCVNFSILDLCTGTGCIALALAQAFPHSRVMGIDINPEALMLAQENQVINGINNCTFLQSNLFEHIADQKFDLIVSNPPYLSDSEWERLEPEVKIWEDPQALKAPQEGYELIDQILQESLMHLTSTSRISKNLWIEIGSGQGAHSLQKALQAGYQKCEIIKDLYNKDRVLTCTN